MSDELTGSYRYELRSGDDVTAIEEARMDERALSATRRNRDGLTTCRANAVLDDASRIVAIELRYTSTLFKRDARYRADGESLRGSISVMAGRNEVIVKLGRFGEVEVAGAAFAAA